MIRIEYQYPWANQRWHCFCSARTLAKAVDLLDACRVEHPGSHCRIREERPFGPTPAAAPPQG